MGRLWTQGNSIVCASAAPINFTASQAFSVSFWAFRGGEVSDISYVGHLDTNNNFRGWELQQGLINLLIFNLISTYPSSWIQVKSTVVDPGTFCHRASTYDGSGLAAGVQLWVNGTNGQIVVNDSLEGNTTTNSIPLRMGTRLDGTDPLGTGGKMAEVGVWNTALTTNEIASLTQGARCYTIRPQDLVAYYPIFGNDSPEPDLSGNASNGTLTGTAFAADPSIAMFTPRWRG
jgi:Concanavalin A-like lectin/glucanases superfamily